MNLKAVKISVLFLSSLFLFCSNSTDPSGPSTNVYQKEYSELVDSLKKDVEYYRGKPFLRDISLSVLNEQDYKKQITGSSESYSSEQKNFYNNMLKCEGLLRKTSDYFADYEEMLSTKTAGFYTPGTDKITVVLRGTNKDPDAQMASTLFHELIHAMQDQYHDLTLLDGRPSTSDASYAYQYVVEGEAELLETYYDYVIFLGYYPVQSTVESYLNDVESEVDDTLDAVHKRGDPLFSYLPNYWAYYSFGPKFIDSIAGTDWSIIDNKIFASFPNRTSQVLHPSKYPTRSEQVVGLEGLIDGICSRFPAGDDDELGEVLLCTMLREWDIDNYKTIAEGLEADRAICFGKTMTDSLQFIWYTQWEDESKADDFFNDYISIAGKKWGVTLPQAQSDSSRSIVADQQNRIYIEKEGTHVFTIEKYASGYLDNWISQLRAVKPYTASLAKRKEQRKYPVFIKKRPVNEEGLPIR